MFTCISCRVAFENAAEQRNHFATDWHRYNMKRRVANLPPVPATAFNEKVIERREQNAVRIDPRDLFCVSCSKSFSTDNAYQSHLQSKKHRERQAAQQKVEQGRSEGDVDQHTSAGPSQAGPTSTSVIEDLDEAEDSAEDDDEGIDERLAAARRRIRPSDCLFCPLSSVSIDDNVLHMAKKHSFFIPDQDILIDLPGLLSYLGEKIVLGNLCIFCPNGGREFSDTRAVRKHMIDKYHCKLAYETDEDRAEIADFYDFTGNVGTDSDWEEVDGGNSEDGENGEDDIIDAEPSMVTLAPDGLSLMLPSGRTLGHRSLKVYYSQHLRPSNLSNKDDARLAKVKQVRDRLADPTLALVPVAGGQGGYGKGLQVMKARNAGEAKWARKQAGSYKDVRVREAFKTRVGYVHNNQKHFRDPLLQ